MVSYKWKKLNPNIAVKDVKKKLFNQYFYSIKYYCPGGRIILQPNMNTFEKIDEAASKRVYYNRFLLNSMYYGYDPVILTQAEEKRINSHQLIEMLLVKRKYSNDVKIRVVEPYITFYANSEDTLLKIAESDLYYWGSYLEEVYGPKSDDVKEILDKNVIFVKKDNGYQYKFVCKEGMCANKASIYSYLDQLGDQIKVSGTVWTILESSIPLIRGVWFYSNNKELSQVLNIIEPNFVTNIHELVVI